MKQKVTFLTEGGIGKGLGHVSRITAYYEAFREQGFDCEIFVEGDEEVEYVLNGFQYQIFKGSSLRECIVKKAEKSESVVIDSYSWGIDVFNEISSRVPIPVLIEDDVRSVYPKGNIINGNIFAPTLPYPEIQGVRYFLGTEYTPLRCEFWDVEPTEIRETLQSVLITFGGADSRGMTRKVIEKLLADHPEKTLKVVLGGSFSDKKLEEDYAGLGVEFFQNVGATEMLRLMKSVDAAVCAGGQTLYELARLGIPVISICVAENQRLNLRAMAEAGFVVDAGDADDADIFERVADQLENLRIYQSRLEYSRLGKKIIDGQGVRRFVKQLIS